MTALRLIYETDSIRSAGNIAARNNSPKRQRPEGRIDVLYALDSVNAL